MDGWFVEGGICHKIFGSPLMTVILIVVCLLLIMFVVCYKYFTKSSNMSKIFKIAIYALLVTGIAVFIHDRVMESSFLESHKKENLEFLHDGSLTIGKGEILYETPAGQSLSPDSRPGFIPNELFE